MYYNINVIYIWQICYICSYIYIIIYINLFKYVRVISVPKLSNNPPRTIFEAATWSQDSTDHARVAEEVTWGPTWETGDFSPGNGGRSGHPPGIKRGNGKSARNGRFNDKVIYKWWIVHCHVWLPDGKTYSRPLYFVAIFLEGNDDKNTWYIMRNNKMVYI